ncbi:hypothetical protein [Portibacter marinus]|uniref:hypothetical protein n=1 Tax=Portibacter marinus TaxID=2898660 RepID=UPI001F2DC95A|nr:hypothetical protein [Portibacter marinus]
MKESENKHEKAAENAANAAMEYQISEDTRAFLSQLSSPDKVNPSRRLLYLSSAAATVIVMIASLITINLSHSDAAIASEYGINKIVSRTGGNVNNSNFTAAVRAYYENDYDRAEKLLSEVQLTDNKVSDYKEWLSLLITLQTAGSKSETFNNQIELILADENHEFYFQAQKMKDDMDMFWRNFVFTK